MHNPRSEQSRPTNSAASKILLLSPPRTDSNAGVGPSPGQRAAELAHDARNLFSALNLYCELLAAPGVLAPRYRHYAEDLRLVAGSGVRLIEALARTPARNGSGHRNGGNATASTAPTVRQPFPGVRFPGIPFSRTPFPGIDDLAAELIALEAPLRALAGPDIRVEVECAPCAGLLALNSEDLLRILFNLVANTVEAVTLSSPRRSHGAFLRITAQRAGGASFHDGGAADAPPTVVLSVHDNGPGIAAADVPYIFEPGFSTHPESDLPDSRGVTSRGLGLSIVRQLAEAAGGAVRVVSPPGLGARFEIEVPILSLHTPPPQMDFAARPELRRAGRTESGRRSRVSSGNGRAGGDHSRAGGDRSEDGRPESVEIVDKKQISPQIREEV
jgi:signal transduction histidine kinase